MHRRKRPFALALAAIALLLTPASLLAVNPPTQTKVDSDDILVLYRFDFQVGQEIPWPDPQKPEDRYPTMTVYVQAGTFMFSSREGRAKIQAPPGGKCIPIIDQSPPPPNEEQKEVTFSTPTPISDQEPQCLKRGNDDCLRDCVFDGSSKAILELDKGSVLFLSGPLQCFFCAIAADVDSGTNVLYVTISTTGTPFPWNGPTATPEAFQGQTVAEAPSTSDGYRMIHMPLLNPGCLGRGGPA
jgi:hypothetical protein